MTEKIMERRRRYRQRHRRNTIATWIVGVICAAVLVFLAAMGCMDYVNKLPPQGNPGLPELTLGEASPQTPAQDTQPQEPAVYEDGTDWNLRLVNRWNPIPEGYNVSLKELPGGEKVDQRIYDPLMEMLEAAREGNWDELPRVISGYRTQEEQQRLYDEEVSKYKAEGCTEEEAKAALVENAIQIAESDEKGLVKFEGLKYGNLGDLSSEGFSEYWIAETKAPVVIEDGVEVEYNLLRKPHKVVVNATSHRVVDDSILIIENNKTFLLPFTGGIGTTLFTVGGIALLAAGGVLFIKGRRKEQL